MPYLALGILILTQGASFLLKAERRFLVIRLIFVISVILFFGWQSYLSYQQYQVWSQNELSQLWLPPHQSITYFISYIFTNFFLKFLIALVAGLIFLIGAIFLNKKFQERFFEKEEPYLGALAIFLVGHPLWMYYFITILIIGVLGTLFFRIINLRTSDVLNIDKSNFGTSDVQILKRFPLYHFWLPLAILVLIIGKILI